MFETPIKSGLRLRCGRCGEGKLFRGYLKFADQCQHCDLDFSIADTADGPAFFVGFLIMILFAPFYFILPVVDAPWPILTLLWVALLSAMGGFCYALLPRFKGVLFNLQVRHKAEEAKFESTGTHGAPPKNWKG
ncbi:MAG: DUF983 domain-containing protein [Pseudomonadota bacterium]